MFLAIFSEACKRSYINCANPYCLDNLQSPHNSFLNSILTSHKNVILLSMIPTLMIAYSINAVIRWTNLNWSIHLGTKSIYKNLKYKLILQLSRIGWADFKFVSPEYCILNGLSLEFIAKCRMPLKKFTLRWAIRPTLEVNFLIVLSKRVVSTLFPHKFW